MGSPLRMTGSRCSSVMVLPPIVAKRRLMSFSSWRLLPGMSSASGIAARLGSSFLLPFQWPCSAFREINVRERARPRGSCAIACLDVDDVDGVTQVVFRSATLRSG
jgi:hypothetical protein